MQNRIGASTILFRERTLEKSLEIFKNQTNIRLLDLVIILPSFCPHYNPLLTNAEDDKRLNELFQDNGFNIATLNIAPGYFNKNNPEEVNKFILRCADIAKTVGAHSITIPSGVAVDHSEWVNSVNFIKKYILGVNKQIRDRGLVLSIETPHIKTLTESIEEVVRFHEMLNEPTIKCTLDTSHVGIAGDKKQVSTIQKIGFDKISHIHLRDFYRGKIDFTPGKGQVDYVSFFNQMKENNYTGDYIFELEYDHLTEKQKIGELIFAKNYCEEILSHGHLSVKNKIATNGQIQLLKRFFHDPKAEIKRHEKTLKKFQVIKGILKPYLPEVVYDGQWSTKVRWGKNKVVNHRKNSIPLQTTSDKTIKVGIVGCGWAGTVMHAPGFERLKGVELIGGYDIDHQKSKKFSKKFKTPLCESLDELIDRKPDIIAVCSREWAHYEPVVNAFENGIDIFCEKLLATRYKEAKEMVEKSIKYNRVFGVNYNYHYIPGIKKLKEIIEHKALGELCYFTINVHAFSYAHALDLLEFLGGKIKTLSAFSKNNNNKKKFGGTDWSVYDEDILYIPSISTNVSVEFANGGVGVVNSSFYYDLQSFVLSIEAVFEEGNVSLSGINMFDTTGYLTYLGNIKKVGMDYKKGVYAKGYEYTFFESIKDFMEAYISGKPVPTSGEQGLFNMHLEKLIHKSSTTGVKINLDEETL